MFEKAQFTLVNEHFEAIFDKDITLLVYSAPATLYTITLP